MTLTIVKSLGTLEKTKLVFEKYYQNINIKSHLRILP